jgi:hypothetical protein
MKRTTIFIYEEGSVSRKDRKKLEKLGATLVAVKYDAPRPEVKYVVTDA